MKSIRSLSLFFLLFIISCGAFPSVSPTVLPLFDPTETPTDMAPPPRNTVVYGEDPNITQNPERGFATDADPDDDYSEYYADGYALVYADIRLDDYRTTDLPEQFLREIDANFEKMQAGGVKAIVRFSYNDGPYPDPEPDASLQQILRHIEQVKPVLQENFAVIAWMEAGFIGAWGEWHASTNGLDQDMDAKKQILSALLSAIPERAILLRYPVDMMVMYPTPLSQLQAYTGIDQARVGFHNDCFLSSFDDEHTYGRKGIFSVTSELDYLSQTSRFVPVGGESCAYNPPRSDCPTALKELTLLHFSELNDGWHPDVLDAWEEQGCYAEISTRLGYRFQLLSSLSNDVVRPGGILDLDVQLKNTGFASMINARKVYALLTGPRDYRVVLTVDPRFWAPGGTSFFQARLRIPADAPEGTYELALWLPDGSESLQSDPRYAVRFANYDVWDSETGANILRTVEVTSQADGEVDPAANEFVELP
jgi:hypothetical protein